MPRKKNTNGGLGKITGTPVLANRATCHVCRGLVGVDADEVLVKHPAHPSIRPKGVYIACEGTGGNPTGRVIHGARLS
jgi:hypothetical protein